MVVSYIDDETGAPLGTIIFSSKILSLYVTVLSMQP